MAGVCPGVYGGGGDGKFAIKYLALFLEAGQDERMRRSHRNSDLDLSLNVGIVVSGERKLVIAEELQLPSNPVNPLCLLGTEVDCGLECGTYDPPTGPLRPHCCGLYGAAMDAALRRAMGEVPLDSAGAEKVEGA
jgi:hypothetical protein